MKIVSLLVIFVFVAATSASANPGLIDGSSDQTQQQFIIKTKGEKLSERDLAGFQDKQNPQIEKTTSSEFSGEKKSIVMIVSGIIIIGVLVVAATAGPT